MRAHSFLRASVLLAVISIAAATLRAQTHEIAGSLGAILGSTRTSTRGSNLGLDPDVALGFSYDGCLFHPAPIAIYAGLDFVASTHRGVNSLDTMLTRDIATLFLTPHLMVKFTTTSRRVTPWIAVGGGVSVYEQSLLRIDGLKNPAPRDVTHGAFTYGAGVDVSVWRFIAFRGQFKDFYTGNPSYNAVVSGGQHNVVFGGALVFRWG